MDREALPQARPIWSAIRSDEPNVAEGLLSRRDARAVRAGAPDVARNEGSGRSLTSPRRVFPACTVPNWRSDTRPLTGRQATSAGSCSACSRTDDTSVQGRALRPDGDSPQGVRGRSPDQWPGRALFHTETAQAAPKAVTEEWTDLRRPLAQAWNVHPSRNSPAPRARPLSFDAPQAMTNPAPAICSSKPMTRVADTMVLPSP
jgi:hypothetical protein